MPVALDQLPDDLDALKSLVADQSKKLDHFAARNEQLQSKVISLQEQLNLALARRYAASSEKLSPDQIRLFDEAEVETQAAAPAEDETITVPEHAHRQRHALPVLDELRSWLDEALPQVPPTSATGKALNYLHNEWGKLIRYLDDGRLEIDNNGAENAIRPFVLGRKNWLFSASVKGVKASANLYSLIETVKANGLEPYAYLRHLFTELPKATTVEAIEALLPGNLCKDQIRFG
jgi:transposase